ncbi:TerB family tellurite resistance protein [Halomonas getboli]|uniref:tellurite resistance TerB family protein n=1 Tax=Halomonas getboli TaxID=2935862 RepID=UPI001FFFF405|nr:TerB family tellurite resistance protein [Halomonas getboli]MCK2183071.1 TerB family tellurite resistance protein [Halomonas getboli]
MIQSLQRIFQDMMAAGAAAEKAEPGRALATAVLLCEVIRADYHLEEVELERLASLLAARFSLPQDEAQALVRQACDETESAVDHHRFLKAVRDGCEYAERVELVREMWTLALVDGVKDPLEEHRIRRLAELLHVGHGDFIRTRLEVERDGE